ncbi:hypothetical protein P872_19215 [Rhodonellum psychrophilum GCM71 = DSM 17998]|uniref:Uncharacterized protein n=1 Tax=Rhodonellum psychrophilum GCM71 = DSM 17998 TaxID=1123057 RepID=U5BYR6_9BACT|nr:hypothetical protein P872_19215 [Rhodonellum psychrophilum GCM71 = DSM 17998]
MFTKPLHLNIVLRLVNGFFYGKFLSGFRTTTITELETEAKWVCHISLSNVASPSSVRFSETCSYMYLNHKCFKS